MINEEIEEINDKYLQKLVDVLISKRDLSKEKMIKLSK